MTAGLLRPISRPGRCLAALLCLLFLLSGHAAGAGDPHVMQIDLRSGANGLAYRVFILAPEEPPPEAGYPVVYLLDGNATFPLMRDALARSGAGPVALVGIGYPTRERYDVARRYHDLTPPTPAELVPPPRGVEGPVATGGQDDFLALIEKDVMPQVERRLPVDRNRRTLFGHSLGGLFTLHVLFTRGDLFQAYVAADPSVWWNGRSILEEMRAFAGRVSDGREKAGAAVLVETSGLRVARPGVAREDAARWARLRSGPNGRDVAAALAGIPGLRVSFRAFDGESHGSMLPPSVADALSFALGQVPEGAGSVE